VTGEVFHFNPGSSKGVREFFKSDDFFYFVNNNKANFEFYLKRGFHPFLRAIYANGFVKDVPLRNNNTQEIKMILNRINSTCIIY
jgi:hypothetical protein